MCMFYYSVVILSLLASSHSMFCVRKDLGDGPGYIEITSHLSAAVVEIVQTSFIDQRRRRSFNLFGCAQHLEGELLFGDIMEFILRALGGKTSVRIGMGKPVPGDYERHYNVLLVDSIESLKVLYADLIKYNLNTDGYNIIILHTFDNAHYYGVLFEIFELNWTLGIIDVNVLVYALTNLSLLYHIQPFNQFHCKSFTPTIENRFTNSRWRHTNFYPDKLLNLHGCALLCAIRKGMPYYIDVQTKDSAMRGIEGKLLEYLASRMNFSYQFHWLNLEHVARILDDEKEIFVEAFDAGIDMAVGGFRMKASTQKDPYKRTDPYFLRHFKYIINSNLNSYSPNTKSLLAGDLDIAIYIWLIYIGVVVLRLLANVLGSTTTNFIFGIENRFPLFNMVRMHIGVSLPITQMPKRNFARYIIMLWILMMVIIRNSYFASIFYSYKINIQRPLPNSMQDLLDNNYQFLMNEDTFRTIDHLTIHSSRSQILNMSYLQGIDLVRKSKERIAFLMPQELMGNLQRMNPTYTLTNGIHVVKEPVLTQELSLYMAGNTMLLRHFNQIIHDFINNGLFYMWIRHDFTRFDFLVDIPNVVLNIDHINGACYTWLVGNTIAGLQFCMEIYLQRFPGSVLRFLQ